MIKYNFVDPWKKLKTMGFNKQKQKNNRAGGPKMYENLMQLSEGMIIDDANQIACLAGAHKLFHTKTRHFRSGGMEESCYDVIVYLGTVIVGEEINKVIIESCWSDQETGKQTYPITQIIADQKAVKLCVDGCVPIPDLMVNGIRNNYLEGLLINDRIDSMKTLSLDSTSKCTFALAASVIANGKLERSVFAQLQMARVQAVAARLKAAALNNVAGAITKASYIQAEAQIESANIIGWAQEMCGREIAFSNASKQGWYDSNTSL